MPISTQLPGVLIAVEDSWYFPVVGLEFPPLAVNYGANTRTRSGKIPARANPGPFGGIGGAGSTFELSSPSTGAPGNQLSARVVTTAAANGSGWLPYMPKMSYGPASAWGAGAITAPASVIQVHGVSWANSDAVDNWPDDTSGFTWIPNAGGANFGDSLRLGAAPLSGFGVFFNSNGAGGVRIEYMAWNGAAVVERVALGAGIVTDITQWNSLRFILVTAANGRESALSIDVNGSALVTDKQFGTDIPFATAQDATALGYTPGHSCSSGGGASWHHILYGYDGRFSPDGVELQRFGG